MKRAFLAVAIAATSAWAEEPADFRSSAAIHAKAGESVQRVALPFEAYRDARRDLADLRIFNGRGEALPFAFASEEEAKREARASIRLAVFPVMAAASGRPENLDVVVRTDNEGAIVRVEGRRAGSGTPRPVAWLLDASAVKDPLRALLPQWNARPGAEVASVTVEGSDDLKTWRTLTSRAAVVRIEQAGEKLEQRRVDLGAQKAKYLRVTAQPEAFELSGAEVELGEVVTPPAREKRIATAAAGAKPGEYLYDLGARLPVEELRVVLPEVNSIAPFAVSARETPGASWQRIGSATFYRLMRGGVEIEAPALAMGHRPARYWMLQLDPRSPAPGGAAPSIEARWRPAQVVFVARGEGPYTLAFGNPDARATLLAVSQLIPGYEAHAEWKLPEASLGEVKGSVAAGGGWRAILGDTSPRKALLWAVLVAAVLVMAWMAWRLQRQMRETTGGKDRGG